MNGRKSLGKSDVISSREKELAKNERLHRAYDNISMRYLNKDMQILEIDKKGRSILGNKEFKELTVKQKTDIFKLASRREKLSTEVKSISSKQKELERKIKESDRLLSELSETLEDMIAQQ